MQKTRECIVHILKTRGQATVDELSQELGLTSVTIRHHLEILRGAGFIAPPQPVRREGPGRPQYLYRLAEGAAALFPSNYDLLASELLKEMRAALSPDEIDRVVERIAGRIAGQAEIPQDVDFSAQLEAAVQFLNEQGYMASIENDEDGQTLLHVHNCPYGRIVGNSCVPCLLGSYLLFMLLGRKFSKVEGKAGGDDHCVHVLSD